MQKGERLLMKLFGISEVAKLLSVSPYTLRRLIKAGQVRSVNVGARVLITSAELDRVMTHGAGTPRPKWKETRK
jgi:excisionase family DNA binding protein